MRFELEVIDPDARELFAEGEKSLQRFGKTRLIDKTASTRPARFSFDGYLTITDLDKKQMGRYVCEAKRKIDANSLAPVTKRLREAASTAQAKPLLIAPYVTDSLGEQLRASGVAYIDGAGNAYLTNPPVFIWMRGFRPTQQPERVARAFHATGLQLVGLLLSHPDAIKWSYRKLAEDAGLSLGSASRILSDLRSLGFVRLVAPGENALVNRRNLLEHWEFGYATRLRPRLKPLTFRRADDLPVEQLTKKFPSAMEKDVLIGGELAAAIATRHLRPQTATFHVRQDYPMQPFIKEMKLIPDRGGNITLIEQFGNLTAWTWDQEKHERLIHPLLTYAELISGKPDDRLLETAKLIFDEQLAAIIDHEPTDRK